MSNLQIVTGDILEIDIDCLAHQCNCVTNVSAHMAKAMFDKFPWSDVYSSRKKVDWKELPENQKPGNIIVKKDLLSEKRVISILGQLFPGKPKFPDSKVDGYLARETNFLNGLKKIRDYENFKFKEIAFPYKVGCGAAGGNWDHYYQMLETFANKTGIKVVIVQRKEDGGK